MTAWFRRVQLFPWTVSEQALPEGEGTLFGDEALARLRVHGEAERWHVEALHPKHPTLVNGAPTARCQLRHGDTLQLRDSLLVFETRRPPAPEGAPPDATLGTPGLRKVWADWLTERGDPRGLELAQDRAGEGTLEGLARAAWAGSVEWDWSLGLGARVRIRSTPTSGGALHRLARLLVLPTSRWITELTIDLVPLGAPETGVRLEAARLVRLLLEAPPLPRLERLSLGYLAFAPELSHSLEALVARLPARFPGLATPRRGLLQSADAAVLDVVAVPPGLDFHPDPARPIALGGGLWVGSSHPGSLRALGPATRRSGMEESFLVIDEVTAWTLVPLTAALQLNGRPAPTTRLLPGDVIADPSGVRFAFRTGPARQG